MTAKKFFTVSFFYILYRSVMGSVSVSGWSSPESISEDLAEPGTRRFDITAGLGGMYNIKISLDL